MQMYRLLSVAVVLLLVAPATWAEEETVPSPEITPVEQTETAKRQRPSDPDSPSILREPRTPKFKPYWYFDAGLGYSDFSDPVLTVSSTTAPVTSTFDNSGDDFLLRLLGGYQINSFFAVESGLVGFGGEYEEDFIITGAPTTTGSLTFRGIEAQVTVPAGLLASPVDSIELTSSISGLTFAAVGSIPTGKRFTLYGKAGVLFWNEYLRVRTGAFRIRTDDDESSTDVFAGIGFRYQIGPMISFGFDAEHFQLGSNSANVLNGMVRLSFGKKKKTKRRKRLEQ